MYSIIFIIYDFDVKSYVSRELTLYVLDARQLNRHESRVAKYGKGNSPQNLFIL
jgi:hypothetical protein